ncbi:hypothetical protein GQ600_6684 [Phytophthora cactorum]|nr:hypothetical protein GQ600_6684 [Phytophthora cactorum]
MLDIHFEKKASVNTHVLDNVAYAIIHDDPNDPAAAFDSAPLPPPDRQRRVSVTSDHPSFEVWSKHNARDKEDEGKSLAKRNKKTKGGSPPGASKSPPTVPSQQSCVAFVYSPPLPALQRDL